MRRFIVFTALGLVASVIGSIMETRYGIPNHLAIIALDSCVIAGAVAEIVL